MSSLFRFRNERKSKPDIVPSRRINTGYVAGTYVSPETAKKVSGYYRGLVYISTQIAKLPLEIKDYNNKAINNDIYNLLNVAPNNEMTAFTFKTNLIQCAINEGNGYAEIERDRLGRPVKLHLLNPNRVVRRRTTTGEIVWEVMNSLETGGSVFLPYEDVLHLPNLVTKDGQIGNGLVGYAQDVLGISIGSNNLAASLYENGGMPSGVVTVEGNLSDEAFTRIKETWRENHGGRKSGGTAVLEEGAKYTPVSFSPDVLQFLESRKFSVLEIARFLGLPPTKLFDGDSATYNNIEHANLEVATDTLDTWARNFESEIDVKLLNNRARGFRSEFDMYAVFRGDMNTRANYFQKMMQNASITPNEIRKKEGLAPYEDGDRFYVATNNFSPADRIDEVIDSQINKGNTDNSKNIIEDDSVDTQLKTASLEFLRKKVGK